MGGGTVLEAVVGLCHHIEEVHVLLFGVKMVPKGHEKSHNFAHICSTWLKILLWCYLVNVKGQLHHQHHRSKSLWNYLELSQRLLNVL